jgi:hypothetical protein
MVGRGRSPDLAEANTVLVLSVDVVDDVIRYIEITTAETEAGQRVVRVLNELGVGGQ